MRDFLQIKEQLLKEDIKLSSFKVFCILLKHSNNGICYPSYSTMSEYKVSERTVKESIKELEQKGLILKENRIVGNGKKTSNCYYLNENYLVKKQRKKGNVPEWFNQEIQTTKATEEEIEELDELLKGF